LVKARPSYGQTFGLFWFDTTDRADINTFAAVIAYVGGDYVSTVARTDCVIRADIFTGGTFDTIVGYYFMSHFCYLLIACLKKSPEFNQNPMHRQ
jgi:hypothetical protein